MKGVWEGGQMAENAVGTNEISSVTVSDNVPLLNALTLLLATAPSKFEATDKAQISLFFSHFSKVSIIGIKFAPY